jgi:hypothetical protein
MEVRLLCHLGTHLYRKDKSGNDKREKSKFPHEE